MSKTSALLITISILQVLEIHAQTQADTSSKRVEFRVALAIDGPVYIATLRLQPPGNVPVLKARLMVTSSRQDITLHFPDGKICDLRIRAANGKQKALWSKGMNFPHHTSERVIGGQETEICAMEIALGSIGNPGQGPWAAGEYTAEAWIEAYKGYVASLPFTLQHR